MIVSVLALVWLLFRFAPLTAGEAPIRIALRPAASSHGKVVLIGDIADVRAPNREAKEKVARIDVADPVHAGQSARLSRSQVTIRLMLAGFDTDDFRLAGAEVVNVSYDSASQGSNAKLHDAVVLDVVRAALARQLNLSPDNIHLKLMHPIRWRADYESIGPSEIRLEARLPGELKSKVLTPKAGVHVGGRLHEILELALEAQVAVEVPKARRRIWAGEMFTSDNIHFQTTRIDLQTFAELPADAIGKRAVRDVRAGDIVVQKLVTSAERVRNEILVRSRETVQLVARRGPLVVKTQKAVALDSGRLNDQVQVKNLETGRVVRGRVVQRWIVEVNF